MRRSPLLRPAFVLMWSLVSVILAIGGAALATFSEERSAFLGLVGAALGGAMLSAPMSAIYKVGAQTTVLPPQDRTRTQHDYEVRQIKPPRVEMLVLFIPAIYSALVLVARWQL